MSRFSPLSTPLAPTAKRTDPLQVLAERIRLVLETRPGTIPWRPDFGCDLDWLLGQPLTASNVRKAEEAVATALRTYLPDISLTAVTAVVETELGLGRGRDDRRVPASEAALLPYGGQASLVMSVSLKVAGQPVALELDMAA